MKITRLADIFNSCSISWEDIRQGRTTMADAADVDKVLDGAGLTNPRAVSYTHLTLPTKA